MLGLKCAGNACGWNWGGSSEILWVAVNFFWGEFNEESSICYGFCVLFFLLFGYADFNDDFLEEFCASVAPGQCKW